MTIFGPCIQLLLKSNLDLDSLVMLFLLLLLFKRICVGAGYFQLKKIYMHNLFIQQIIIQDAHVRNWLGVVNMEENNQRLSLLSWSSQLTGWPLLDFPDIDFMPAWTSARTSVDTYLWFLALFARSSKVSTTEHAKNSFSCLGSFIVMGHQRYRPSHYGKSHQTLGLNYCLSDLDHCYPTFSCWFSCFTLFASFRCHEKNKDWITLKSQMIKGKVGTHELGKVRCVFIYHTCIPSQKHFRATLVEKSE